MTLSTSVTFDLRGGAEKPQISCKYLMIIHRIRTTGKLKTVIVIKCRTYPPPPRSGSGRTSLYICVLLHKDDFRSGDTIKQAYLLKRQF